MMIKENKRLLTLFCALSVSVGIFVGLSVKKCPKCVECNKLTPSMEREAIDKAIEVSKVQIKKETNETIKEILSNSNVERNDSIWRVYSKRFN